MQEGVGVAGRAPGWGGGRGAGRCRPDVRGKKGPCPHGVLRRAMRTWFLWPCPGRKLAGRHSASARGDACADRPAGGQRCLSRPVSEGAGAGPGFPRAGRGSCFPCGEGPSQAGLKPLPPVRLQRPGRSRVAAPGFRAVLNFRCRRSLCRWHQTRKLKVAPGAGRQAVSSADAPASLQGRSGGRASCPCARLRPRVARRRCQPAVVVWACGPCGVTSVLAGLSPAGAPGTRWHRLSYPRSCRAVLAQTGGGPDPAPGPVRFTVTRSATWGQRAPGRTRHAPAPFLCLSQTRG